MINESASLSQPSAYAKLSSWGSFHGNSSATSTDCCSWDGVECDEVSGHVIGLDLSSSFLCGSINSTSSLFRLIHLQNLNLQLIHPKLLNLANNDSKDSSIPAEIGHLKNLVSLNLTYAGFSHSQIPSEISQLSNLVSLALSGYLDMSKPSFISIFQNLTKLRVLELSGVNISSTVPNIIANMSSLVALDLSYCGLYGEVPIDIFLLPNLQNLDMTYNENLKGHLPEFQKNNSLANLMLDDTAFSARLPDSTGNLKSLLTLSLRRCSFSGSIPTSLANLTQLISLDLSSNNFIGEVSFIEGLSQLNYFSISDNNLNVQIPTQLGMLLKLIDLDLRDCNINGNIPSSMANLSKLVTLDLHNNCITGTIPLWLTNLTEMQYIYFGGNQLQGSLAISLSQLKKFELLDLSHNNLIVSLDCFWGLKNLIRLALSSTRTIDVTKNDANSTLPKLQYLYMSACNLRMFPNFLRFHHELQVLDLSFNHIEGMVQEWLYNISMKTLRHVDLSHNSITSFEKSPTILPWSNLLELDLSYNRLEGSLSIPPKSMIDYRANNNNLIGEIPQHICSLFSLQVLDLSNNKLDGIIPPCLGNFNNSLVTLKLSGNNFHGIHQFFANNGSNLRLVDFSRNQIQGKIPRSFINFKKLQFLALGNNEINDTFPHWLGALEELQVLILRSNKFHGGIKRPKTSSSFVKLRIIDLSDNDFTGNLPLEYISNWKAVTP